MLALTKLAKVKGYTLAGCDSRGVNAFFVRNELIEQNFVKKDNKTQFRKKLANRISQIGLASKLERV